uniref:GPI ethanolamine phosphate transferase 2 C-terminal domain-containing protein n=1 Tax=Psilocybe cubensis TaxID=181762 RepID=A0A8H7Y5A2_PSICU
MLTSRLGLILWVLCVHLAGIYLFTRGFLLTRLSLSNSSTCEESNCGIQPTHKRAVLLIIDSLRFDFITPNPPSPRSPFHHGILTLPSSLTRSFPKHSFIFNSYADPPTTTLQRIKGLTTGSLPTFVDLGNNFGGSSIAEDSILKQMKMAGKKVISIFSTDYNSNAVQSKLAFLGDDTWMSVFPKTFNPNMTFPYDSFNVEDLHTVDDGIIKHLFPLLEDPSKPFDFLIGHFLGVDHVGHRLGPDHPSMKLKLEQMNAVLTRVVETIDEDTLLVVLGDHGMDRSGDHGGDGTLETSAGMWIYSKGAALMETETEIPSGLLQFKIFPGCDVPHRSIQQIDILPTLSLLLGFAIPYNNLGTVIPELFWRDHGNGLLRASLEVNAAQIMRYLQTYRNSASGGELNDSWEGIIFSWTASQSDNLFGASKLIILFNFTRVALAACREMWAQFNPLLMGSGLVLLSSSLCASWSVYLGLTSVKTDWREWLKPRLSGVILAGVCGAILGIAGQQVLRIFVPGVSAIDLSLFTGGMASSVKFIISSPPKISFRMIKSVPILLVLHTVAFLSNSFTFWEDRFIPFFLVTSIVPYALKGFSAPNKRLRYRILGFSLLFAVCVRLIAMSTICREEQQPYCHATYFISLSNPSPPTVILYFSIPLAIALPYVVKRFLHVSRSDGGISRIFLPFFLIPALVSASLYWIVDLLHSEIELTGESSATLRTAKTWLARLGFGWILLGGGALWFLVPLCLDIQVSKSQDGKRQIQVVGYANAYGSPYLIFWSISLGLVYISTQLTGHFVLAISIVALLSFLELLDSYRDTVAIHTACESSTPSSVLDAASAMRFSPSVRFIDVIPIALLGLHAFYGTGHQSTIQSIQWKSGFMITPTANYFFAPITVLLNSVGPVFLFALATPLAALWNRSPLPISVTQPEADVQVKGESTLAALGIVIYYSALLLGSTVSAAVLRRHLMVWKVFAPRFMTAVLELLAVDLAVLIGVGVGLERIVQRLSKTFHGEAVS